MQGTTMKTIKMILFSPHPSILALWFFQIAVNCFGRRYPLVSEVQR